MARPLKTKGLEELGLLRSRVNRQYSLGRIQRMDAANILRHLDAVEDIIRTMSETNEEGEDEPIEW